MLIFLSIFEFFHEIQEITCKNKVNYYIFIPQIGFSTSKFEF